MQAEHDLLADNIRSFGYGVLWYLDDRLVDRERQFAFYYTRGLMGSCKIFTLVHHGLMLWVTVQASSGSSKLFEHSELGSVTIPPEWDTRRNEFLAVLVEAVHAYHLHHNFSGLPAPTMPTTDRVRWTVTRFRTTPGHPSSV
ncbi:MAG TPA: hypothetical protein VGC21_25595 [Telluria sp.]|jgi:hypothetical protein